MMFKKIDCQKLRVPGLLKQFGAGFFVGLICISVPLVGQEDGSQENLRPLFETKLEKPEVHFAPIPPMTSDSETAPTPLQPLQVKQTIEDHASSVAKIRTAVVEERVQAIGHDIVENAVDSNPVAHAIGLQPIQSGNQSNGHVANTNYNQGIAAAVSVPEQIEMTYQLTKVSGEALEQRMVNVWSNRMRTAKSEDGRFIRVMIPNSTGSKFWPMTIDLATNYVKFDGNSEDFVDWQNTMLALEQQASAVAEPPVVTVPKEVPQMLPPAVPPVASHVAPIAVTPEQNGSMIQQVARTVPVPRQDVERQIPVDPEVSAGDARGEIEALQRNVNVQFVDGMIIVNGSPEDVKAVEQVILELNRKASLTKKGVKEIQLKNATASIAATKVQEIYDEAFFSEDKDNAVSIKSLDGQNKLIVAGSPGSIKEVEAIVEVMDSEIVEEEFAEFEVFEIKHISAIDAQDRIDQYFGQSQNSPRDAETEPAPLPVVTVSDFRSNKLIIKGSPRSLALVRQLLDEIDVDESTAVSVVKVFPLRNSTADTLAPIVQDILNGQLNGGEGGNFGTGGAGAGGGSAPESQRQFDQFGANLKSSSLDLVTVGPDGKTVRHDGGITFDVRVTPDSNSNSLVVKGPEKSMEFIEALIKQLDRLPDVETQIKVFQVINGDAADILESLQNLFDSGNQGNAGGGNNANNNNTQLPLQSASSVEGQSLANLRFAIDGRTNTIIASGPVGDLIVIEDLINRLDEASRNRRQTTTYRLSNLSAEEMATAINEWLTARDTIYGADPSIGGEVNLARRSVTVTPLVASNSLIVSAVPEYYDEIARIIRELDRRPPMIKVKALIAEVNLNTLEEFGVDLGIQDSLLFDRGVADGIGFNFNQNGLGNTAIQPQQFAGQVLSNLGVGRTNSALGYGGLVLSAGSESISVLIRALQDKNCLRVLNKPTITTLENLQGRVQVGASVPRISESTQNALGGGVSNSIDEVDVGIVLEVTPRVSPDGTIVMFVNVTKSSLGAEADGVPVAVAVNGDVVRQAPINQTTAQTTIQARSGQTVVISGLVQEEKAHAERGAPILSDLPVIGSLFKFETDSAQRNELIIFLTPYIVDNDVDVEMQNQDEMDRMHWCLNDVAEMYGNTQYDNSQPRMNSPQVIYPDVDPTGLQQNVQYRNQQPAGADQAPAQYQQEYGNYQQ